LAEKTECYLVLCVDRDDDLGEKAKVGGPVFGREEVLSGATKLALADPEEADANAMFAAVKKYDELKGEGMECEVAVVCGNKERGFAADRAVSRGVESILKDHPFVGIVFVSDGGDDEHVIPVLQTIKPIVSVERVAVKHSQTVEETYLVLGRYLRMLVFDTRYSKWALGVPGVILILVGLLAVFGAVLAAQIAAVLIIGGAALVRGFNLDRYVATLLSRGPLSYIRLFSLVTSILVVLVGFGSGYDYMEAQAGNIAAQVVSQPSLFFVFGAQLVGYFITGSLLLIWVGLAFGAVGSLLAHLARESPRWRRDAFVLVMLALLYFPVNTFSAFLIHGQSQSTILLISYALVGLAMIFGLTVAVYPRVRVRAVPERE
jgi:putative membrane protein